MVSVTPEPGSDEPSAEERPPRSVAIIGSCLTRDLFTERLNPGYKQWFRVDLVGIQPSMISLMSPPVDVDWTPLKELDDYLMWTIRTTLSRDFRVRLPSVHPNYILVDFLMDAVHGVARLADGRYIVDSPYGIHHTDWYQREEAAGRLEHIRADDEPDRYFTIWVEAMDRFAELVATECPNTRVIVHAGRYTERVMNKRKGKGTEPFSLIVDLPGKGKHRIADVNRMWARFNEHAASAYGWDLIDIDAPQYPTEHDHPWGPSYAHYRLDYYRRVFAELHLIDLADRLDADEFGQVADVVKVVREAAEPEARLTDWVYRLADTNRSLRRRNANLRRRVRRLRRRVDRFEAMGPFRAAGSALKRRLRARRK